MSLHYCWGLFRAAICAAVLLFVAASQSAAIGIHDYRYQRSFSLPAPGPGSNGNVLFDALPDGRLLLLNGITVSVETAPQSAIFTPLGAIPGFTPSFGPSFLAVSPDGTRAAAGSNGGGSVFVFNTAVPTVVTSYLMDDFAGEWLDNQFLAVANGFGLGKVDVLNTANSVVEPAVANIVGASSGVSIDGSGNLYVGNGFGDDVGLIKAFSAADWQAALANDSPLDFESEGTPIAKLLTAYPIGFDSAGNMFAGGGDFYGSSNDFGYAALVDADAIAGALANPSTPSITTASLPDVLRKFISPPETVEGIPQPPSWNYNAATGELYLNYIYGDGTVYVYAVPEPSAAMLLYLGGIVLFARRSR